MSKLFRINAGTYAALVYLLIFLFGVLQLMCGAADALFGLGILIFTLPWSFILLDWVNKYMWLSDANSDTIFYSVISLCILLNALFLHFAGWLFTITWQAIFRKG